MSKTIIVGGVAGGASCAARLRRLDENMEIIIIEKSHHVSYANCGLPYYIGNVIVDENDLLLQTPESLKKRFNIDVRVDSEVVEVDVDLKRVSIKNKNETYEESYDYLVLATGSKARKLYENEDELYHLKNVEDVELLKGKVTNVDKIAVIGGGFIGVELAENLNLIGKKVTIFEYTKHIMPNLDEDIVYYLEKEIRNKGIELLTSSRIVKIVKDKEKFRIILGNESEYCFDLVVVAAGVEPNTDFLKNSGISMDFRGFIETDEHMMTNIKDVYACGDATISKHFITGKKETVALAGPANKQGRIIADNICGFNRKYDGSIGSSIVKVFDLAAGSAGLNKVRLDNDKYNYNVICLHPNSHASYYPDAKAIHAKLYYDNDNLKILGVQAVGKEGVDKLIDVIATAIKLNAKVTDLAKLELSYAPPFLSAKSPANYFGFVAQNVIDDLEELVTFDTIEKDDVVLDVRTVEEYEKDHLEGAINIPVDELRERLVELEKHKEKTIYIYCAVGIRAHISSRILRGYGFNTANITGGYTTYKTEEE